MTHSRVFRPGFFEDAKHAKAWYEHERVELGAEFSKRLDEVVDAIAESPDRFTLVDKTIRVGVVRPFAYGVYFTIEDDQVLFLAVIHLHRRPGLWRGRRR